MKPTPAQLEVMLTQAEDLLKQALSRSQDGRILAARNAVQ